MKSLMLLPHEESIRRHDAVVALMRQRNIDALLICDNANLYYLTGRVFSGYVYIPSEGPQIAFVKRPVGLEGDGVVYIRKPEQIAETIGLNVPSSLGFEFATASYAMVMRLSAIFPESTTVNASEIMQMARSVKTPYEIELMKRSGRIQTDVYHHIPALYTEGMTDFDLQIEIERLSRMRGCLGQFRVSGDDMELFMGNILVGENADNPTPYDFAMGGAGLDPSLPVGADGTVIRPGLSVMVDVNGNYTGYMTDMTRTYAVGGSNSLSELAVKAYACSVKICREVSAAARPGVAAKDLYEKALAMAREAGLERYFMGLSQKAGFVGHGVGIEINERPVIAPRSRDVITEGNVFALEPKFVCPHTGAVGIENTYVVGPDETYCITNASEDIIDLL